MCHGTEHQRLLLKTDFVGVPFQKRRSSRQVKRKRYTEDLEFKISDEEADDADAAGRDSPSHTAQAEQQVGSRARGVPRGALKVDCKS